MQGLDAYEKNERLFMKAVAQGLMDIKEGKVLELNEEWFPSLVKTK